MTRHILVSTALICAPLLASTARAGDAATAEALFRQGRSLMDAGDYATACPKLAESYAQDPATGTLLALAVCQESAGQTATAWATYADAAARAKQDGRSDREQGAREAMAALEPKLSRLTITVSASGEHDGLVVKRDGKPVGPGAWGTPVPADPGEHVIEAVAPGKQTWRTTVTIGPVADARAVEVPPLEDEGAAVPAAPAATSLQRAPRSEDATADEGASGGAPLKTAGLLVGGAGILSLAAGTYFGLSASSLNDESSADGHCDAENQCDPFGGAKRDDAGTAADIATVALIAGGVLTATGVTLFLVGGPEENDAQSARVEAAPVIGPSQAGMFVRGSF